ncbi:hypothetical protein [Acidianus brierleyi]|uniref:Uncharacterized protein n=1 Tax=Acidianus brierleyi TaxID=41673 RepID=A0A2U9ID78_9CREN|nr:hypothetical protein [Acidianus brierleyi]AWR93983.1 hypothetical protein DFR85_04455 [Acidianus brierleyi]
MDLNKLKYSIGSAMFFFGSLVFLIIFTEIFIMNYSFNFDNFHLMSFGYPWASERVMKYTGFIKMPDFSNSNPDVYFLNYGEAMFISLIFGVYGVFLSEKYMTEIKNKENKILSRTFFTLFLISFIVTLIAFIRIQVLSSFYFIGNTLLVPDDRYSILNRIIVNYNIDPSNIIRYNGGVFGTQKIWIIDWDILLLLSSGISFVSYILWKYFSQIIVNKHEIQ